MADEQEKEGIVSRFGRGTMREVGDMLGSSALSSALMQGAFEKFGQAFTDTGFRGRRGEGGTAAGVDPGAMQPWRAAGLKAANALERRWQVMEYEDFQESHVEGFKETAQELQSQYQTANTMLDDGLWTNPVTGEPEPINTATQAGRDRLERYRGELHTKFYTQLSDLTQTLSMEGIKYKGNEMIQEQMMKMFEHSSAQLQNVANPEQMLRGEKAYSDISVQERNAAANEAQARAATKAAKKADRPISVKEALADPAIGVENILPWAEDTMMNSNQAGAYIRQGKAVLTDQLHEVHKAEWVASGGKAGEYDKSGTVETNDNVAWVESQLAQSGGAIQRAATVEFVKAKDPDAAEAAKQHSPQYFDIMGDAPNPDAPKGIISDKRITETQRDDNVRAWKQPLADKLEAYMSDPKNDPDIEVAIAHIVEEWLPGAITGATKSTAPTSIQATQSQNTVKYRQLVAKFARRYLENEFYKISKIAAEQNKQAALIAKKRKPRRGGGLGRAITSLFGDE